MKEHPFPISYFMSCFLPKKMFLNRFTLNVWQIIVVIVFLIFLMMNPVAMNANKFPEFKLNTVMPDLMEKISSEDITKLNSININDGKLTVDKEIDIESFIFVNASKEQFDYIETGINFEKNSLVMKDKNGLTFRLNYPNDFNFSSIKTNQEAKDWLSTEWNRQNSGYRIISLVCLTGFFITCSTLFLVFGASFFIWLTKKNYLSTIKTFKESVNLILNALFISTSVATIVGLVFYDITLMITIQSFVLVLEILLIFYKTKFNDSIALK